MDIVWKFVKEPYFTDWYEIKWNYLQENVYQGRETIGNGGGDIGESLHWQKTEIMDKTWVVWGEHDSWLGRK